VALDSLLHSLAHDHVVLVHVSDNGLRILHVKHVLASNEGSVVVGEASITSYHILILHPFCVNRSSLGNSFFSTFKHSLVLVKSKATVTMVLARET